MFERFTDRARKVMALANQEVHRFNHEFIGTEHILLGLLRESEGIAAQVLMNFGLQIEQVRDEVLALKGEKEPVMERGPRTWEDKRGKRSY